MKRKQYATLMLLMPEVFIFANYVQKGAENEEEK